MALISDLIRCTELPSVLAIPGVERFPFLVTPTGVVGGASGVPGVPYMVSVQMPNPLAMSPNSPFFNDTADGIPFTVRAAGRYVLGGSADYQIDLLLLEGTSLPLNDGSAPIATTSLRQAAASSGLQMDAWEIEANMIWDATSLNLRGSYSGVAGTNVFGPTGLSYPGGNPRPASISALMFGAAATSLNPNPANSFTLSELSIELL